MELVHERNGLDWENTDDRPRIMDLTTRNAQILSDSYFTAEYALPGKTDYLEEGMPSSTYESVASFKIPEIHERDKLERTVERLEEMAARAHRYRD